jgi:hypothetical protein
MATCIFNCNAKKVLQGLLIERNKQLENSPDLGILTIRWQHVSLIAMPQKSLAGPIDIKKYTVRKATRSWNSDY